MDIWRWKTHLDLVVQNGKDISTTNEVHVGVQGEFSESYCSMRVSFLKLAAASLYSHSCVRSFSCSNYVFWLQWLRFRVNSSLRTAGLSTGVVVRVCFSSQNSTNFTSSWISHHFWLEFVPFSWVSIVSF